jgi:hypothetical protein
MPTTSSCIRHAEHILQEIETDLKCPALHPLEFLDLWYLRWLTQLLIFRSQAKLHRKSRRRDLIPAQDRYGLRQIGD